GAGAGAAAARRTTEPTESAESSAPRTCAAGTADATADVDDAVAGLAHVACGAVEVSHATHAIASCEVAKQPLRRAIAIGGARGPAEVLAADLGRGTVAA